MGAKNWKRIAVEFLGGARSEVQCMHRWKKALKPGLVKGRWTDEEDDTIINCIKAGVTKWSEIAERTWCSSAKCENFNSIFITQITTISLTQNKLNHRNSRTNRKTMSREMVQSIGSDNQERWMDRGKIKP